MVVSRQILVGLLVGIVVGAGALALVLAILPNDSAGPVQSTADEALSATPGVSPTSTPMAWQAAAPAPHIAERSPTAAPETPTVPPEIPDPVLAPGWQRYRDDRFGFSLDHPSDWLVYQHDTGITIANQEMTCGSCHVLSPGAVVVSLEFSPDRQLESGDSTRIGKKPYPATVIVEDEPGRLAIRIEYRAMSYRWLLQGQFGQDVDLESDAITIFGAMVDSLFHHAPVKSAYLPWHQPTFQPAEPLDYVSIEYRNAEPALRSAFREAGGYPESPLGSYHVSPERIRALTLLYHTATAELGSFNGDTSGFYDWAVEFFKAELGEPSRLDVRNLREHIKMQIRIATGDPTSYLGQRIRQLEAGQDPTFPGAGPEVYWHYLFDPYLRLLSYMTPQHYELVHGEFDFLVRNRNFRMDFGQFLIEQGDVIWSSLG